VTASPKELFGTIEPAPERRRLRAGPLSAVLEEGNLREIGWHGAEAVRAINYLARDRSWGTYKAEISALEVKEEPDAFTVAYDGLCAGPEGRFRYRMSIRGEASGSLVMEARGAAETDFPTNRTGFVVLHPAEAAGGRLAVRHTEGREEETTFPKAISPDQPGFDIAALTHEPAPGLTCTVEMEGDAFEMEDQRNWSDASFKTYVRPLSKPRPYVIALGVEDVQRVTVGLGGQAATARADEARAALRLGGEVGRVPELALFLDAQEPIPTDASAFAGTAGLLIARFDAQGGGAASPLREAAAFAGGMGARLAVEVIFDARDPDAEAQAAAAAIREAGVTPVALMAAPRREFKTRASNSLPPGEHGTAALVDALRKALPGVPVGAGTPSFFTEFNRNPPEPGADFAFFGTSAVVHAADDVSVAETAGVVPAIVESAKALAPGLPLWLGPCLIGMRHNPYGTAPAENPAGGRVPMARSDPRHGALFGAAWACAVAAHAAAGGVARLTLAASSGPFGLRHENGEKRPIFGLHEALFRAGRSAARVEASAGHPGLAALAWRDEAGVKLLVSSLAPDPVTIESPRELQSIAILGPDGRWGGASPLQGPFTLRPYRTALLG
jgi:hypothetical protein